MNIYPQNSIVARARLCKDIVARRKAYGFKNGIAICLRKGFVKGAQGIAYAAARM